MSRRSHAHPLLGGSVSLAAAVMSAPSISGGYPLSSSLDVHLRWFRFATTDVPRTTDFYLHVLKMQLDRRVDTGAKIRTDIQYPGDKVGVRFEYDTYGKAHASGVVVPPAGGASPPAAATLPRAPLPLSPTSSVSLLVYVDNVDEYISRCREYGFVVYLDAVTVCSDPVIRSGVLLDPNGIKIRLMESEIYHLNKMRSRGRLGYVSVPVKEYATIEKCIKFYDDTFHLHSSGIGSGTTDEAATKAKSASAAVGALGVSGSSSWESSNAPKKGVGFRLVDMERFVEELTTYVWLANGSRKKHTAVCLLHRVQRRTMYGVGGATSAIGGAGDTDDWDDIGSDDDDNEDDASRPEGDETSRERQLQSQVALVDRVLDAGETEESVRHAH